MKSMNYFSCIMALFLLMAIGVHAQTPQQVTQGSTHQYHVTDRSSSGYIYAWTLAAPVAGNTILSPTAAATSITWGAAGTYTITLTETNAAGGCATPNTFQVVVLGSPILQFTEATSHLCADQLMSLTLNFTKSDGATVITSSDIAYFPLIVNYTVNGVAKTLMFNAGDALVIPLTASDRSDQAADYNIPVVITSATSNGGAVVIGTNSTNTNTVNDIPSLNPIIAN